MKKIVVCVVVLVWSYGVSAQVTKEILDRNTPVTWLGLDFTPTRFIGDRERLSDTTIQKLFKQWNELMIKEADKYDMAEALHRKQVKMAFAPAMEHNSKLDVKNRVLDKGVMFHIGPLEIQDYVNTYDFGKETGLGVMIVAECFSKQDQKGVLWVTFINIDKKEVVYAERFVTTPTGFGLKNFWARTIYNALGKLETRFEAWKVKAQ